MSWEAFQNTDWAPLAQGMGKVTSLVAIVFGFLGVFLGSFFVSLYGLALGLLLATWELPFLFQCIGPCKRLTDILNYDFKMSNSWVRAVVYVLLSVWLFWGGSLGLVTGVCLLATSVLYVFNAVNGGELSIPEGPPGHEQIPEANSETPFGTFS